MALNVCQAADLLVDMIEVMSTEVLPSALDGLKVLGGSCAFPEVVMPGFRRSSSGKACTSDSTFQWMAWDHFRLELNLWKTGDESPWS